MGSIRGDCDRVKVCVKLHWLGEARPGQVFPYKACGMPCHWAWPRAPLEWRSSRWKEEEGLKLFQVLWLLQPRGDLSSQSNDFWGDRQEEGRELLPLRPSSLLEFKGSGCEGTQCCRGPSRTSHPSPCYSASQLWPRFCLWFFSLACIDKERINRGLKRWPST